MISEINVENKKDMLLSLGLVRKAGKLSFGCDIVCDDIRKRKALLVLLCKESSENTKDKIVRCSSYYKVDCYIIDLTLDELGVAIGKGKVACVSINDKNFVSLINKRLNISI